MEVMMQLQLHVQVQNVFEIDYLHYAPCLNMSGLYKICLRKLISGRFNQSEAIISTAG